MKKPRHLSSKKKEVIKGKRKFTKAKKECPTYSEIYLMI